MRAEGRVGHLEEDTVIELACASTVEWFERGGDVRETGERLALADVRLRAPIVPKKFFHTAGNFAAHHEELPPSTGRTRCTRGSSSSRTSTRSSARTTTSSIPRG